MSNVVVIGAGPIGLFAVFQCGMLGINCIVFDSMTEIGGQCSALYPEKPIFDIPGFKSIKARELIDNLLEQANLFSPQIFTGEKVVSIEDLDNGLLQVTSESGRTVTCSAVLIAAGAGNIQPRRIPIKDADLLEGKFVFYSSPNIETFKDANVVIAGGGDSAADWSIEISSVAKKVSIVHRRNNFKCHPHTLSELNKLYSNGKIEFITPYNISNLKIEDNKLKSVIITDISDSNKIMEIEADYLLAFFGLDISNQTSSLFQVESAKRGILVNRETMETSRSKIYAVGDAAYYTNRPNLILVGFSEVAIACRSIYKMVHPEMHSISIPYSTAQGIPEQKVIA